MSTYRDMAESEEMRQVRAAYAALDAALLAAVKAEGTKFTEETRDRVSGAMLRCRKAIFGDLRHPVVPTETEIEAQILDFPGARR